MAEQETVLPWKVKGKGRIIQWVIYVIAVSLLFILLRYENPDAPYLTIVLIVLAIVIIGYPLYSIRGKFIERERKRIDAERMKKKEEESTSQ